MFTGIVEEMGEVVQLREDRDNLHIEVKAEMAKELKVDQSVAHDGVCLTVVSCDAEKYTVTAIAETLSKTNLNKLQVGDALNLERGMKMTDRLDGHIVQGHVDQTGKCLSIEDQKGSTLYTFAYDEKWGNVTIEKGSITVNGVSLTVVNSKPNAFSVAIIPYTLAHTTFKTLEVGNIVNLEFDVIGKYVKRLTAVYK